MKIKYVRDSRSPKPTSALRSKIMSSIKAKNTKPEREVRKLLSQLGVRGYRLHTKGVPGRPDISFHKRRIALFVHGCFWHQCKKCSKSMPKSNQAYWKPKLEANVRRDKKKESLLRKEGWKVLAIWEHELGKGKLPQRIVNALVSS